MLAALAALADVTVAGARAAASTPVPVATSAVAYSEPSMATSEFDPTSLVGGAISYVATGPGIASPSVVSLRSTDAGATWTSLDMRIPGLPLTYDPSVAFFGPGDIVFGEVGVPSGRCLPGASPAIFTSRNGGQTYGAPIILHDNRGTTSFADKPTVAADPSSGDIYAAWSQATSSATTNPCQAIASQNEILVEHSSDGGKTFGPARRIKAPGYGSAFAAAMATAPGGRVWLAFEASDRTVAPIRSAIFLTASTDRGATFAKPVEVSSVVEPTAPAGANLYATAWPSIAYQSSNDRVYLAWASGRYAPRIVTTSVPGDLSSVAPPRRVPRQQGACLMPSLGPGPVLGFLHFYGGKMQPEVSVLGRNGFVAGAPAAPAGPISSPFQLGEYMSATAIAGRVAVAWPQAQGGAQRVWFQRTSLAVPPPPSPSPSPTPSRPASGTPGPSGSGPGKGASPDDARARAVVTGLGALVAGLALLFLSVASRRRRRRRR